MADAKAAITRSKEFMQSAITIATAASVLWGGFLIIRNNVWKPYITVIDVDYEAGHADLHVNGKAMELVKSIKLAAGGDWAVRFNSSSGDMNKLDRIELVKGDIMYRVVDRYSDDANHVHLT